MLDRFGDFLAQPQVAMVGDLNTSSRVRSQARSHPEFVARAGALGLTSLYHYQTQESHGEESQATYRHRGSDQDTFHIDYCFLSASLLQGARIRVVNDPDWAKVSDHYPIVVDLPDRSADGA